MGLMENIADGFVEIEGNDEAVTSLLMNREAKKLLSKQSKKVKKAIKKGHIFGAKIIKVNMSSFSPLVICVGDFGSTEQVSLYLKKKKKRKDKGRDRDERL